jgi:hypothetical protein
MEVQFRFKLWLVRIVGKEPDSVMDVMFRNACTLLGAA